MSASFCCLCGSVSGSVSGVDKGAVLCHCQNCRAFTGSAFAHNYRFMKAQFHYTQGQEVVKVYEDSATKTGNMLKRSFCGKCGSSLFIQSNAVEGLIIVHGGVIEGDEPRQPKFELFGEEKKAWVGDLTVKKEAKM